MLQHEQAEFICISRQKHRQKKTEDLSNYKGFGLFFVELYTLRKRHKLYREELLDGQ